MGYSALRLELEGQPPRVNLIRKADVPDNFWHGLPLIVAPADSSPIGERYLSTVEQLLSNRRRLQESCRSYGVGLEADEGITALLGRVRREQKAAREKASSGAKAIDLQSIQTLDKSRFRRDLRPFQKRDLAKLLSLEHGCNFSVPGAGKTTVTYALYEAERVRERVSRLLVVAPLSAYEAWQVEAEQCFAATPVIHKFTERVPVGVEVVLVNYQKLRRHFDVLAAWLWEEPSHLVLDEAHRMKRGLDGEWGAACLQLANVASRRDILTGTPAPQGPRDFVALIDFVWWGDSRNILPAAALKSDPPSDALERISEALGPLFVRTTKSELGLDEPNLRVEPVRMKPLQAEIYTALRNRYAGMFDLSRGDQAALAKMGEVTMYLLEAATNPGLLKEADNPLSFRYQSLEIPPGSRLKELVQTYEQHERPEKFEKLAFLVSQNASADPPKKTLVWSNFRDNLLLLEKVLAPHQPALIYGGIPTEENNTVLGGRTRESELARFRTDPRCKVLLANPAAMAEGVSLHEQCHDAIYLERTFNAGQLLQSLDRIHRLGLKPGTKTNITFLMTEGTIDEAVDSRVAKKTRHLAHMLDDRDLVEMALPDEEDYGAMIEDPGDLDALFQHLANGSE